MKQIYFLDNFDLKILFNFVIFLEDLYEKVLVESSSNIQSPSNSTRTTDEVTRAFETARKLGESETSVGGGRNSGNRDNKLESKTIKTLLKNKNDGLGKDIIRFLNSKIFSFNTKSKRYNTSGVDVQSFKDIMEQNDITVSFLKKDKSKQTKMLLKTSSGIEVKKLNIDSLVKLTKHLFLKKKERNCVMLSRKIHDNIKGRMTPEEQKWARSLFKMPTDVECGFLKYGKDYVIISKKLMLVLKKKKIMIDGETFYICLMNIVKKTRTNEKLIENHKQSLEKFGKNRHVRNVRFGSNQVKTFKERSTTSTARNTSNASTKSMFGGPRMRQKSVKKTTTARTNSASSKGGIQHFNIVFSRKNKKFTHVKAAEPLVNSNSIKTKIRKATKERKNFPEGRIRSDLFNQSNLPFSNNNFNTQNSNGSSTSHKGSQTERNSFNNNSNNSFDISSNGFPDNDNELILKQHIGGKLLSNEQNKTLTINRVTQHKSKSQNLLLQYKNKEGNIFPEYISNNNIVKGVAHAIYKADEEKLSDSYTLKGPGSKILKFRITKDVVVSGKRKTKKNKQNKQKNQERKKSTKKNKPRNKSVNKNQSKKKKPSKNKN